MDHGPAVKLGTDNAIGYKSRLGVKLCVLYAIVYAGFIAINVLRPSLMSEVHIFNLNLAVFYGFGLIILAVILGLIYNALCSAKERTLNRD